MNDHSNGYGPRARRVNPALVAFFAALWAFAWAAVASAADKQIRILALGTSLTQGYQLPPGTDFTAVLEARLKKNGVNVKVVNAGVSGDTSAGGLARLDWALSEPFDAAIVELGSNDALRALKPSQTESNLDAILTKLKAKNIKVLFTGMMAPRNLGPDYAKDFDAIYPRLAKKHGVAFYPFFLDGVAGNLKMNQADGIHPNEAGTQVIVGKIAPYVAKLIAPAKPITQ
jgi:acyl-CoA thioesterase-1